jgi:sec-independent protein translocase protein TatA
MGSTSIWHWVIVLLIILLLFGAKRIPELAKGLGSGIKNFKNAIKEDENEVAKTAEVKPVETTATAQNTQQTTTTAQATEQKPTNTDAHKA